MNNDPDVVLNNDNGIIAMALPWHYKCMQIGQKRWPVIIKVIHP